ncbi:MAG: tetratricopeptide repeat protein [Myxococcota bacterium]
MKSSSLIRRSILTLSTLSWGSLTGLGLAMLLSVSGCKPAVKPDTSPTAPSASTSAPSSEPTASNSEPSAVEPTKPTTSAEAEKPTPAPEVRKPSPAAEPTTPSHNTAGSTGAVGETGDGELGAPAADIETEFKLALAALEKGISGYDEAIQRFKAVSAAQPNMVAAHYNRGLASLKKGDYKEAEKAFRRVMALEPKNPSGYTGLAEVYRVQKDYNKALGVLDDGFKVLPKSIPLRNLRAHLLREQGKTAEAIEEIRGILKVSATDVRAFNNMGRTYLELKDYDMAQIIFLKALQTAPGAEKDPWIHNNLGVTYMGLKDPRAAAEFERALELDPYLLESLVCRAQLHLERQEYQKALDLLRRAQALSPDDDGIRISMGAALRGLGEYDRAVMQYDEVLRRNPKDVDVLWNYAVLQSDYRGNDIPNLEKALELYGRLKDLTPVGPERDAMDKAIKDIGRRIERIKKRAERNRAGTEAPAATPTPAPTEGGATPAPAAGGTGEGAATPAP